MATPLLWKAYEFDQSIYGRLLYPHKVSMDISKEKFVLERNHWKLIPFYIGSANILLMTSFGCYIILNFLFCDNSFPLHFVLLTAQLLFVFVFTSCLNYVTIKDGNILFERVISDLYKFERKLKHDKRILGYAVSIPRKKLLVQELKTYFRKDKSTDVLGLLMHAMVIILVTAGMTVGIVAVAFDFDPTVAVFGGLGHFGLFLRLFMAQWVGLETSRSLIAFLLPTVSMFNVYRSCFHMIKKMPPNEESLKCYEELQCLSQIGFKPVRDVAAILMGQGFIMSILGAWILLEGWKIFPKVVHIFMSLITVNTYIVIFETLPHVVAFQELSEYLLNSHWPKEAFGYYWNKDFLRRSFRKDYRIWKKMLTAQRPITFYYGSAAFDKDTKTSFYYNIFMNTVNVILMT